MENIIMKQQKGFTLIELIIVIVVLGILAVTAAPQFINFQSDARASTVEGAKASVQGAMQLAYAKALIDGSDKTAPGSGVEVVTERGAVTIAYGYPTADAAGIQLAAGLTGTDEWSVDTSTTGQISFSPLDTFDATCAVTYVQATATSATPPVITPASVSSDTDGC